MRQHVSYTTVMTHCLVWMGRSREGRGRPEIPEGISPEALSRAICDHKCAHTCSKKCSIAWAAKKLERDFTGNKASQGTEEEGSGDVFASDMPSGEFSALRAGEHRIPDDVGVGYDGMRSGTGPIPELDDE